MRFHVTRAYLDLARAVVDTPLTGDSDRSEVQDAYFGIMSCTCVYSHMALRAFCNSHLHNMWSADNSPLRAKYDHIESFTKLIDGPLRDLKSSLNELSDQLRVQRIHEAKPETWRQLNELLHQYRNYFVHPNPEPEKFHEHIESIFNRPWGFCSAVAAEVISYYFESTSGNIPDWVRASGLRCHGFDIPAA